MRQEQAVGRVRAAVGKMRDLLGNPFFDEWIMFALVGSGVAILHYEGPRPERVAQEFPRDVAPLLEELRERAYAPGHFHFAREADGLLFDAFLAVGPDTYVVFNNTGRSMQQATADPAWRSAQVHFVVLAEAFSTSPVR